MTISDDIWRDNKVHQILINKAQEDTRFKRDIEEAKRHSNETFSASMERMSESILQDGQGLTRSY